MVQASTLVAGMMDDPLSLQLVLRRMRLVHGRSQIRTVKEGGKTVKTSTFADVAARANQLAGSLEHLGIQPGDRVATFAWNIQEHVEALLAVMCMGATVHAVNVRLNDDQMAYTIEHANDRIVIVQASLVNQLLRIAPFLKCVEHFIVIGERSAGTPPSWSSYEELLSRQSCDFLWPEIDERSGAALCYTSASTGNPKGVLYSHRSLVLQALVMSSSEAYGIVRADQVLLLPPLFHAMGWGVPFVCGLVGADLTLPDRSLQPAQLASVVSSERITWTCGVPTIWLDLLLHASESSTCALDLASLRTIVTGGTQVPANLMESYDRLFDIDLIQGWGMTECFAGATFSRDRENDSARWKHRSQAGRASPLYEFRVVDPDNQVLPSDGVTVGEIEVRGPLVAANYFNQPRDSEERTWSTWLRTGDLGTLDGEGWLTVTDRLKDSIKSGGEWISSSELESVISKHPAVLEAAVVGRPDHRWSERPVAFVKTNTPVSTDELRDFLRGRVARWWLPEDILFLDEIPRTGIGKVDKRLLRAWAVTAEASGGSTT